MRLLLDRMNRGAFRAFELASLLALTTCLPSSAGETPETELPRHGARAADDYRFFDSNDAAGAYVEKLLASGQLAAQSGASARFVGISEDARLLGLVKDVFDGFREVFPRETAGLVEPPRVAVVETDIINAFALGPGFAEDGSAPRDPSPWLLVVHTALLENGNTDSELRGVFAHELGHLILRTFPEIQRGIRSVHMIGEGGEARDGDLRLLGHVEKILAIQARIGGLPQLGFPALADGQYPKMIRFLRSGIAEPTPASTASCAAADEKTAALSAAQGELVSRGSVGDLVPRAASPEQRERLEALSSALALDLSRCLAPFPEAMTMAELTAVVNALPRDAVSPEHPDHQRLLGLIVGAERRVDAETPDAPPIDKLLRAEALLRAELVALRADPRFPIERIRVLDHEEDADEASVRVMKAIGDDPLGVGRFLLSTAGEDARARCVEDVAAGRAISFGQLIETHPSRCWRYSRAVELDRSLADGPGRRQRRL